VTPWPLARAGERGAWRAAPAFARAAIVSLYDELALAPKPGLVSFVDSGSHADMDAGTFLRSLFSLRRFFAQVAEAGADGAGFAVLEALGIAAEGRMLAATGGVNTHRGAIFTLGLLCAAAAAVQAEGRAAGADDVRAALRARWGPALAQRVAAAHPSNGALAARRHGLRAAGAEAALGLPTLFEHVVPALRAARQAGVGDRRARLHALFTAMSVLDDTNLVHRGGLAALRDAQACARRFLADGGGLHPQAIARAQDLHLQFVARRLSPGGSADLLAAACLLERVERMALGMRTAAVRRRVVW